MCHLNVLDYTSGTLPPTRTYGRREWLFIPADREHPTWDRRLGNVTIKLQHAKSGVRRNLELDTYAIEEQDAIPGVMGRAFLLVNLTDPEQDQPYQTVIGPNPSCTCTAGHCRVSADEGHTAGCKHRDVLAHLIDSGILDGLDDEQPAEVDPPGIPTRAELDAMAEELGWLRRKEMVA